MREKKLLIHEKMVVKYRGTFSLLEYGVINRVGVIISIRVG